MNYTQNALKHLFLQQSYLDAWDEYERHLTSKKTLVWDYVILTASNEAQAEIYRQQIFYRLENAALPKRTCYQVLADPDGKRVGSGGATLNVLAWLAEQIGEKGENPFLRKRILVIHSGGDSKRVPQYSVCGKLFAPVPRKLPNGMSSTLFDEFMIASSMMPGRIQEGMLVLSGDVLLLFNALQIDSQFYGAAAISMKEDVAVGKHHGVFLNDENDIVQSFLHKQSEEKLRKAGAVNDDGKVDLDTGAILIDSDMLYSLYSLICTDGKLDMQKYSMFVNEKARISFYGDFLYPLAVSATLDSYMREEPEGEFCPELEVCRREIWEKLKSYQLKLLCLSPAEFIHFGTTRELLGLMVNYLDDYAFLGWKNLIYTNASEQGIPENMLKQVTLYNVLLQPEVEIGEGSYLENCHVFSGTQIGRGCVLSGLTLNGITVPDHIVLHGLKLLGDRFVVRIYDVHDNPKVKGKNGTFLSTTLGNFIEKNGLSAADLWEDGEQYLWHANLYPVCSTMAEAVQSALDLYRMANEDICSREIISNWKSKERMSLYSSFNEADGQAILPWQEKLKNRILIDIFTSRIQRKEEVVESLGLFSTGMNQKQYQMLLEHVKGVGLSEKIRIYYALAKMLEKKKVMYSAESPEDFYGLCFESISEVIWGNIEKKISALPVPRIAKNHVDVFLPVRVNWGGGWTDTPPYCLENGGVVLNAAIKLHGKYPIHVSMHRTDRLGVELESQDIGVYGYFDSLEELQDCTNPYDHFALHKAALIACGIIPLEKDASLQEILGNIGGGIYLSTQVTGIPKGSGLGTSSILAGACVKGIFEFVGKEISEGDLYEIVLGMEQLMSTGGGWQDQVGGLAPGIKYITTKPGVPQKIQVQEVVLADEVCQELNKRFALIYTGQRRLARNLLRDVIGGYIGGRPESVESLRKMARTAALMRFELEQGNIDEFAELLNEHWELSVQLDHGSTNTCIEQIFLSCEDLIDGKFISGAGGGGFLQVILKKGVTKGMLQTRLKSVFQDSGVEVWDCEIMAKVI